MFLQKVDNTLVSLLKNARTAFATGSATHLKKLSNNVSLITQQHHGKKFRIFGIKKEDQHNIDFDRLRAEINKELGFQQAKKFTQAIGDSAVFSKKGTKYAREFIPRYLSNHKDNILLYGLTGNVSRLEGQLDISLEISESMPDAAHYANGFKNYIEPNVIKLRDIYRSPLKMRNLVH